MFLQPLFKELKFEGLWENLDNLRWENYVKMCCFLIWNFLYFPVPVFSIDSSSILQTVLQLVCLEIEFWNVASGFKRSSREKFVKSFQTSYFLHLNFPPCIFQNSIDFTTIIWESCSGSLWCIPRSHARIIVFNFYGCFLKSSKIW